MNSHNSKLHVIAISGRCIIFNNNIYRKTIKRCWNGHRIGQNGPCRRRFWKNILDDKLWIEKYEIKITRNKNNPWWGFHKRIYGVIGDTASQQTHQDTDSTASSKSFFANTATNQWYSITLHALLVSLNVETIFIAHRVAVSSVPGYYGIPRWNQGRGQRPFRRILVIQYQSFHWGLNHSVVLELKFLL